MIIFSIFQGLNSLNLFLKDFGERGHKMGVIRVYLVFFYILIILTLPLLLFLDLCIFIYNLFEKKEKREFIKMKPSSKNKRKKW